MTAVARWLLSGVGAGAALAAAALGPALVITVGVLVGLPLLLITTLALVAVYSPDQARRGAAEKILDRLLSALRPREPTTPSPRRRRENPLAET